MEPMQCEETARVAILELLKQRELFVPSAEDLTLEQLQRIYDGFVVPQPRRHRRERREQQSPGNEMENLMQRIKVVYVAGEKRCSPAVCTSSYNDEAHQFDSFASKRVKHIHEEDVSM
ncbi:hypothetical protein KR093_008797 [Drosophila rubida]|uniref:Ashwin n=1 Tax=Drosophila rubida TaxID=30044 RepID=A0AAD4PRA7_9MUSC|nr:hypothetical protein KR093_008797 [Drosophila rubida]